MSRGEPEGKQDISGCKLYIKATQSEVTGFLPSTKENVRLAQRPLAGKWTKQCFVDVDNVVGSIFLPLYFLLLQIEKQKCEH